MTPGVKSGSGHIRLDKFTIRVKQVLFGFVWFEAIRVTVLCTVIPSTEPIAFVQHFKILDRVSHSFMLC